jgi:hypothetical protein
MEYNSKTQECIEEHKYLEEREAYIEIQQVSYETCKYCGDFAYKYLLCQNCLVNHKEEVLSKTGFGVGLITGALLSFLSSGSFPLITAFGFSIGAIMSKIFSNF